MQQLIKWWRTVFPRTYQSEMESFIISRQPASVADVEHWMRYYDRNLVWHRGS